MSVCTIGKVGRVQSYLIFCCWWCRQVDQTQDYFTNCSATSTDFFLLFLYFVGGGGRGPDTGVLHPV